MIVQISDSSPEDVPAQTEFQSGFGTDLCVPSTESTGANEMPFTVASPINPTSLLIGVNLAGAEFAPPYDTNSGQPNGNPNPGIFGANYTYPTHLEIDYYAAKGMSVVRLPFLWERIQHTQFGSLDAAELGRLDDVVNYATGKGLKIEIEPHNYGFGFGSLIGSAQTPNSSFADLWGELAIHYKSNPGVIFGLMNEPHEQTATAWLGSANAAIAAIRNAGAMQEILVPGSYWDGAWSWTTTDNATVIGTGVQDPAHNFALEVHQYLDADSSGTHPGVVSPTIGVERLTAITQWAEAKGYRLFLGEVGVDTDPASLKALDNMLGYVKQHTDVWSGVTYWAGGPWWGNYIFSIEPQNGVDKPQMGILTSHLTTINPEVAVGDAGPNTLFGGSGKDIINGNGGDDVLLGGGGDDYLVGGGGNDKAFGEAGNDTVIGSEDDDYLNGGADDDLIIGNAGAETLLGDRGNDYLDGSDGADLLFGGSGADTVLGAGGDDYFNGEAGDDLVFGGHGADTLLSEDGNDYLNGENGNDIIFAHDGNDTVIGGDGDDYLSAGSGDDVLVGGNGNDTLFAGSGNDYLKGDAGDDMFVFGPTFQTSLVIDFTPGAGPAGHDVIQFATATFANFADATAHAVQEGTNTVFTDAGGHTLTLANVLKASLGGEDFTFA